MEIRLKRFLSLALAILMVIGMLPMNVVRAEEVDDTQTQTTDTVIDTVAGEEETYVAKIGDATYATFDEAITAANALTGNVTVEIHGKVEYSSATANLIGAYDSISFVGKTTNAEISITRDGSGGYISGDGNDCTVNFTDLILSKPTGAYASDAGFMNVYFTVYRVGAVNYTNCTFPDGACAQGCPVTYRNCNFANQTSGEYSLWVYAATTVTVENSQFTGVRGAKMYGEGAAKTGNLVMKNTTFTESVTQKPAIVLTYGESVTLSGNTYPAKGVFELDKDGAPNGTTVTSADAITCVNDNGSCGVLVDGKIYTTVADAAEVAASGSTVTLLHNSTETVELAEGVTLNTNGYTAENVTVATPEVTHVAKIGETGYATLAAAVEAANAGDTIVLHESVDSMPTINKAITIKGAEGKTVAVNCAIAENFPGIDGTVRFEKLTFNDRISTENASSDQSKMKLEFADCTFNIPAGNTYAIQAGASWNNDVLGELYVADCTFNAKATSFTKGYMVYAQCVKTVTVKNSTFDGGNVFRGAIHTGDSTDYATVATIDQNTFKNIARGVQVANRVEGSTLAVTDNTFENVGAINGEDESATVYIHEVANAETTTVTYTGNEVGNSLVIFSENATGAVTDFVTTFTGNTANLEEIELEGNYSDTVYVAPAGPVEVATFDELVAALANGGEIKLTADITTTAALTTSGVTATIDLNGKTLNVRAGDNKFNDATNLTIKNGNINIDGVVVSGNAIFCLDEYEETLVTTLTLNDVNLTGKDYSSAYGVFYIGKSSVLNVNGGEWTLTNDLYAAGGVFKADDAKATLNIDGLKLTAHNVRRVVTYANTTIKNSTIAITGDADGVDAEMEHGFNRSPLAVTNSTITMENLVGRGITAECGAVSISENSTVTITNAQEATIDVRGGQTVTVDSTSTVTVDAEPTITSGTVTGVTVAVKVTPAGDITTGYVTANYYNSGKSGIFGQADGVVGTESFEVKLYSGETLVGTAALVDTDKVLLNGTSKSITWHILTEEDDDSWWDTDWVTALNVNAIPDKIELWVDGVLVDTGVVELNNTDLSAPICAAVTDANGNVQSFVAGTGYLNGTGENVPVYDEALQTAFANVEAGQTVAMLRAGTYAPFFSGKDVTITGAVDGVVFEGMGALNMGGASVTFNNVTFNWTNANYTGLQHAGNLVYNNCTINGQPFLYGTSETFNKCTFNQTSRDAYNVWTYGADKVAFNECTFNSAGKSVLVYNEGDGETDLTVTKTTFKASQTVEGKAAIEIDTSLMSGSTDIVIDGETTATGFATGSVSGNSLWNNKKGNADEANNDITVTVAGEVVLEPTYAAVIGETKYATLQAAIDAAQTAGGTVTITLRADVSENVTVNEAVGLHLTIDGADKTMNGTITVKPLSDTNDNRRTTIQNVNFVNTADTGVDFITANESNHYPRLTVLNCSFTGNGKDTDVAIRLKSSYDAEIKNCTGTGLHSFLQNTAGVKVTVQNVTITESKGGLAMGTAQDVTIRGCNITTRTYGIRLDAVLDTSVTLNGNTVNAYIPVSVRKATATDYKITLAGSTSSYTATNTDGKWMAICATEYEEGVALNEPTGNVKLTFLVDLDESGVYGAHEWPVEVVLSDGSTKGFDSLALAMSYAPGGTTTKEKVVVYQDITEEIQCFDENIVCGDPDRSVTITNTFTSEEEWVEVSETFTIGAGVTVTSESAFITNAEVTINGDLTTKNLYIADNAKVSVYGSVLVNGATHIRRNTDLTAGIYIYGDSSDKTVEYKSTYYTGHYSGTFYAKDANVEVGYFLLKNTNDETYGTVKMELDNSAVTVVGTEDTQDSFHIDGTTALTLSNGSAITDVRDFNVLTGTSLTLSVDDTSSISATNMNIAEDVPFVKVQNADGTYGLAEAPTVFEVSTKAELDAAIAAAEEGDTILLTADIDYGTDQLKIEKPITLDLGGKTLTTRNAWGGMSLKNNPTVKNGTIVHASNTAAIKAWNVASFEDLTIDVQGKGDANKTIGGIVIQEGTTVQVGSIKNVTIKGDALTNGIQTYNCGNATEPVIGSMENVTIDANGTGMLISAPCGTATNCTINGDVNGIEIWIKGTYSARLDLVDSTVNGGVYAHDELNESYTNDGTLSLTADDATTIDDVTLALAVAENVEGVLADVKNNAVAKIGYTYYTSLEAAIAAAQAGETVELLADVALTDTLSIEKSITIDGNGHKLTPADSTKTYNSAIMAGNSGWGDDHGETIKLVDLEISGWKAEYGVIRVQGVNFEMDGCKITGSTATNASYGVLTLTFADSNVKNTEFANNTGAKVIDINSNGDGSTADITIDGCTFESNTCSGAGVIVNSESNTTTVKDSKFLNNTVNTTGNAATLYMGFGTGGTVSGCTFDGNTVTTSHATTKRLASAIFCDGCTVNGNVFLNNTATRNGEDVSTAVAVGAYYGAADIGENYWGEEPVPGVDYTIEYSNEPVAVEDYYAMYDEESGELSELTEITYVAKVGNYSYTSLEAAIATAQAGETVTMLADYTGKVTVNKAITLAGNGKTVNGSIEVTADGAVLDGVNLRFVGVRDNAQNTYGNVLINANNVTVKNCNFYALYDETNSVGLGGEFGMIWVPYKDNITFENCVFETNAMTIFPAQNSGKIDGCTFKSANEKTRLAINNTQMTNVVISNNTFHGKKILTNNATFEKNAFIGFTSDVVIWNTEAVDLSGSYWGTETPDFAALLPANSVCTSYYTDAEMTNLVEVTFVAQAMNADGTVVGVYSDFESAIAAACADETITRIEILSDYVQTSVKNTENYNDITGNLTIGTPEGERYTVTVNVSGDSIALRVMDGGSLTIEDNVTIEGLDVVANGFATTGENMTINGTLKALSLKQWTSNGTITVSETGSVWLGYSDGQLDLAYGNGTVTVTGTGDKTTAQFRAGYSGTRGDGNTLNLKDTYFEAGSWFTVAGSNGTINADNALLAVSGGDAAGYLTISSTGNAINLTNGSELRVATLTIGEGNTVTLGASSSINATTITGAGKIVIDATGMTVGTVATISGNASTFTGTIEVINNDKLEASVDENGNIVLTEKKLIEVTYADGTVEYFIDMLEAVPYKTNYDKLEGATIKLLGDVTGKGIRFMEANMVLNLNGYTYTINNATGSSGSNTSGFQIRAEAIDTIIKNGTIKVAASEDMVENTSVVWMFNNYASNFVVENVTVDCTNMAYSYAEQCYVHVSRSGDNTQFTGTTNIINFNSEVAGAAVNVGGTMTIADTANAGGTIELDEGATLTAREGLDVTTGVENAKVSYENGVYSVVKAVAKIGDVYYYTLAEAIAAVGAGDVVIELLSDATLDYNAREAYGTAETTSLTINGNGHTLTLNQKDSDWSSLGLANAEAKLVLNNMTIEKTGYGDTSGAWNTHAINITCPVEMTAVTVNNSVAVQAGATLNNVTINEANGYYGLWIEGNGQTVTVNGGAINATNGGRGIKIADEYVGEDVDLVTLTVDGTKFNTAKKAAVLVSSTAGAKVTASNVNISNVAADSVNFVWVDEDWAAYYGNVTVEGGTKDQEGEFPIEVKDEDGNILVYYKTLDELFASDLLDTTDDLTVNLLGDVEATKLFDISDYQVGLNFVTSVEGGVTMTLADGRWSQVRYMSIGKNITLNAHDFSVYGGVFDIYGTVNADYFFSTTSSVTVKEGGVLNATAEDATVQVKNNSWLEVYGTVNAGTVNVWNDGSRGSHLIVSGENAALNASHIHAWNGGSGNVENEIVVENGATLTSTNLQADRGATVTVDAATLTADTLTLGYEGNIGTLTVLNNGVITNGAVLDSVDSTVTGPEGLNVTSGVDGYMVVYEDGVYKLAKVVATIGDVQYLTLQEAVRAVEPNGTVTLHADVAEDDVVIVNKPMVINSNGCKVTEDNFAATKYTDADGNRVQLTAEATNDGIIITQVTVSDTDAGEKLAYVDLNNDGVFGDEEALDSLQAALDAAEALYKAQTGDKTNVVVRLNTTALTVNAIVVIPTGVTLDIQSNTLTVKSLIGVDGSLLTGTTIKQNGTVGGRLVVAKDNLILDEDAPINASDNAKILPTWDTTNNNFMFTKYIVQTSNSDQGLYFRTNAEGEEELYFKFSHSTTPWVNQNILNNGGSDNGLTFIIRLEWTVGEEGTAYQDFVYKDEFVATVADTDKGKNYAFTLSGYEALGITKDNITVYGAIVADSGVMAVGESFTSANAK